MDEEYSGDSENTNSDDDSESGDFDDIIYGSGDFSHDDNNGNENFSSIIAF